MTMLALGTCCVFLSIIAILLIRLHVKTHTHAVHAYSNVYTHTQHIRMHTCIIHFIKPAKEVES